MKLENGSPSCLASTTSMFATARPFRIVFGSRRRTSGRRESAPRSTALRATGPNRPKGSAGPVRSAHCDAESLPPGLQTSHVVAERTWGFLRVIEGSVLFWMEANPPLTVCLCAGDGQSLPPGVPHALTVDGPVVLAVDFLVAQSSNAG